MILKKFKQKKEICNICLESVKRPAQLQLLCDCKYYCHYKCFNEWWKIKRECIICHKRCNKPEKFNFKNKTPTKIRKRYRELDQVVTNIENTMNSYYYEEYIENQITPNTPCDNENELVTCLVGVFIVSFLYLIIYM